MAAALFSQTVCQRQLAAATTQVSALINGVRGISTHRDPKGRQKKVDTKRRADSDQEKSLKVEPLDIESLSLLLHEVHVTCPTTALVKRSRSLHGRYDKWLECHTSAASFFENKTAPSTSPPLCHRLTLPSLHSVARDPLFSRIFNSVMQHSHCQTRGFKTKRQRETSGSDSGYQSLGSIFSSDGSRESKHMGASGSKPSPAADQQVQAISKAFQEGFRANSDKDSKKRNIKWAIFIVIAYMYYMGYFGSFGSWFGGGGKDGGGRGLSGGLEGILGLGKNFEVNQESVNVNFDDVRGAYEAKEELSDIVHFLKDPEKYTSLGANLPKGVLLIGPPGVGKTLLARAVAGEAGVPFFHASGSEFDEMYVGVGAKRVRQMFAAAKAAAPCIIFIDEFDSIGAKRTNSTVHPYANQTVNQLLNELDGFKQNEGIVVMGATNKVENLDKALRRPGRFDVEVTVSLPDLKARKEILELYISKIKKDPNIDVERLAKATPGFSGAEIENLVNQAALKAVIAGFTTVNMDHFEFARDKLTMGAARKHKIPDEETNRCTAFHEAGHTLVAYFTQDAKPLHKVTMLPRGQSLGHTAFMDDKDVVNDTVSSLKAQLDTAMGGRLAEELTFGVEKVTTGASSDLVMATRIATFMVTRAGMSDKVGLRVFGEDMNKDLSPAQMETIDGEIRRLMMESNERARAILKQHSSELKNLAEALLKYETLNKEEITTVIEGRVLKKLL